MESGRCFSEEEIVNFSNNKKGVNQLGYAALFYMINFEDKIIKSLDDLSENCKIFLCKHFKSSRKDLYLFDFKGRSCFRFVPEIKKNFNKITL
ncbi:MAG: hypothetical protein HEEMFOPI_01627 [Holosporales bacterium]